MQEQYDCFYMVADLHSLTVFQRPEELQKRVLSFFAQYLACGLDPDRNVVFVQSHVPEHAELCWALNCITPMGALNRMTQFKEKSERTKEINNGLYTYPVLMAADILLYQADLVPVGADQKQHLELTRDLALSFNKRYGSEKDPIFTVPEPFIGKSGARIMSLQDPDKKMSKSDENPKAFVSIIDPPKKIQKKIKAAVTDSDPNAVIKYDEENKKGLANLMTIYSVLSGQTMSAIENEFEGKMYGHLKVALADLVCDTFAPVQKKYQELMENPDHLKNIMKTNAERARSVAGETLKNTYQALGLVTF
jgi:tryptophanyl-tRNA synthetase